MKLVATKFKLGGLHEKHVVATWNIEFGHYNECNIYIYVYIYTCKVNISRFICLKTQDT